jgi:DNA-binding MarR family transcriptional regulator
MPVKSKPKSGAAPTVEQDLAEFASLLTATLRDLKTAGPPPIEIRQALERASLGKRHMPTLLAVAAAGPIGVSELAKRIGLLLSSTSTLVGELNRAGLLERAEDDEDHRRTIVRLHEDYRAAMESWLEIAVGPIRKALERLSPPARAHFMEGWRILQEEAALRGSGEGPDGDCEA